jgi:hypothetical protein
MLDWLGREYDVEHVTLFEMIGCDAILWRCESLEVWQCNALLRFIMWESSIALFLMKESELLEEY